MTLEDKLPRPFYDSKEMYEVYINLEMAIQQRKYKLERAQEIDYEQTGCYECDGYNTECLKYYYIGMKQQGGL